jgi:hypothetical protein
MLFGVSLLLAPSLFALSSFFWVDEGQYGITGSTLLIFGSVFWIAGFVGIFRLLRDRTPRYAAGGLLLAIYGAVCGGAAFAFQGLFAELYDISHEAAIEALASHPFVANAIFWVGGPAFPVSLLILGIVLARTQTVPLWVGLLLSLGGALFPVARIPRIDLVAHLVDLLMLIPTWYIGVRILQNRAA